MATLPFGLQLYTVRDDAGKDLDGTLAKLVEIGYRNVELAGFYGLSASALKTKFDSFGLKPIGAHVGFGALASETISQTVEDYLTLGVYNLIVPHIGGDLRQDGAGYPAVAAKLNELGETLSSYGLKIGYHNHDFEFKETFNGKPGIEILIEETDLAIVASELDTYWALYADYDPVAFINKYKTRFSHLHIKDLNPEDKFFAEVGTGLLPLDGIIAAAVETGVQYLVVEQDATRKTPLESVTISFNNLKAKGYV